MPPDFMLERWTFGPRSYGKELGHATLRVYRRQQGVDLPSEEIPDGATRGVTSNLICVVTDRRDNPGVSPQDQWNIVKHDVGADLVDRGLSSDGFLLIIQGKQGLLNDSFLLVTSGARSLDQRAWSEVDTPPHMRQDDPRFIDRATVERLLGEPLPHVRDRSSRSSRMSAPEGHGL